MFLDINSTRCIVICIPNYQNIIEDDYEDPSLPTERKYGHPDTGLLDVRYKLLFSLFSDSVIFIRDHNNNNNLITIILPQEANSKYR